MEERKREIWFICQFVSCFRAFKKKDEYKKHKLEFHKKIEARQIVDNLKSPNFDQKYSNKDENENEGFNADQYQILEKTGFALRNRRRRSKKGRGRPPMNSEELQMKIRRPNLNINSRSLFHCSYCNYSSFKFAIIVHERIHTNERPFECRKCKSCFISNAELLKHFRSKYHINSNSQPQKDKIWKSPTREFVATIIDDNINSNFNKKFPGEGTDSNPPATQGSAKMVSKRRGRKIKKVKKITLEETVDYKCLECDYKTTYKNNLKIHQAVHLKDKPFSCFYCPYKTAFTSNLNYHVRAIHKKY